MYMQRLLVTVHMSCDATRLCVERTDGDLEEEKGRVSAVVMADWVTMHAGHTWLHPALLQLAHQVSFLPSTDTWAPVQSCLRHARVYSVDV